MVFEEIERRRLFSSSLAVRVSRLNADLAYDLVEIAV